MSEGLISITNIKFSVKVKNKMCLKKLHAHCTGLINSPCRLLGSKLVIRIPNQSKRIIVFPKKKGSIYQHINFTGINNFSEIDSVLSYATVYLDCALNDFENLTIDNIWAKSFSLLENMRVEKVTSLNLRSFQSVLKETLFGTDVQIRFRPESFSAIVFRGFNCTTLIYSTGSVIIVGARDYSCLVKVTELLSRISLCQNFVLTPLPLMITEQGTFYASPVD